MKNILNIFKSKEQKARECAEAEQLRTRLAKETLANNIELFSISLKNVSLIKAAIRNARGRSTYAKGDNAAETRKLRENIRSHADWLEKKLGEEIVNTIEYSKLCGIDNPFEEES